MSLRSSHPCIHIHVCWALRFVFGNPLNIFICRSIYLSIHIFPSTYLSICLWRPTPLPPHSPSCGGSASLSLSLTHTHTHTHTRTHTHTHTHTLTHTRSLSLSLTHTHGTKERPSRPAPELEPFWPLEPFPPSRSSCPPPLMSASVSRIACTLGV
jgi:hypothetical protein